MLATFRIVQNLFNLEFRARRTHRRGAEDAEGAQRILMLKPLRFLRVLCACGGESFPLHAQVQLNSAPL
jgi:hypothetical protein